MARKTKKLPTVSDTVQISLSRDLACRLMDFANARGTDIETLVRVAASSLLRTGKWYALDTRLAFGKYIGETMETVIRLDPGYVTWILQKVEGLCISDEAAALLDKILAEQVPR